MKEQALFADRLALLLGVSMSLPESIAALRHTFGARRELSLIDLQHRLTDGSSFESALHASRLGFSRMIILAARIGERSGTLSDSLHAAAGRIERGRGVKSALISTLTYPIIIFIVSSAVIAFLVFFIMPRIMPTIQSLHVPLPAVTVFFISISHFLASEWWKIALEAILAAYLIFFFYKKSVSSRNFIQRCILWIPIVSKAIRAHTLSEIFDTISTLVSAGCPFIEAAAETGHSISLIPYEKALSDAVAHMQSGSGFSSMLRRRARLFPSLAVDSIAIGEQTGTWRSSCRR